MNKKSLQQLIWLLFGVGLLTLLVIAGRNTSSQLVKKEEAKIQETNPTTPESVSEEDVAQVEKPDAYQVALQLFNDAPNLSLSEQVSAALAIDSLASTINDEKLIAVLQSKSEKLFLIIVVLLIYFAILSTSFDFFIISSSPVFIGISSIALFLPFTCITILQLNSFNSFESYLGQ